MMPTLLYRGHNYVQHKEQKTQKDCVELTYRRNHYNTCRSVSKSEINSQLAYRGHFYQNQFVNSFYEALLGRYFFCLQDDSCLVEQLLTRTKVFFVSPHKLCMQMLSDDCYILCPKTHLYFYLEQCKRIYALYEYRLMHF